MPAVQGCWYKGRLVYPGPSTVMPRASLFYDAVGNEHRNGPEASPRKLNYIQAI